MGLETFLSLLHSPPLVLICDCGLTCRSCTLRRLLMAKLKWKQKSKSHGFFRKILIFLDPYIGI